MRQAVRRSRYTAQAALLGGVSALALLVHATPADAVCLGRCGGGGAASATAAAASSAIMSAQQAAAATQQSMYSLSRATQAIQAMQAAQTAAHNLAGNAPSNVPNGLTPGGLQVAPGVATDPTLWHKRRSINSATSSACCCIALIVDHSLLANMSAQHILHPIRNAKIDTRWHRAPGRSPGTLQDGGKNHVLWTASTVLI
jgi:hypothetical protein